MPKKASESWTEYRLKTEFKMTLEDWDNLFASQGNRCAICGAISPGRKDGHWCLDHDHSNGKHRGILCNGCNMGLGNIKDNKETLSQAIAYIQRSRLAYSGADDVTKE